MKSSAMDDSSLRHGGPAQRIPKSFSTGSLDGLLASASLAQPLMSESVTLDSLSSKSTDTAVPPFPLCKLPNTTMIELGDHLQLFSATLRLPKRESRAKIGKSVVTISSPTSPRLKSMLKECLSIRQWAESSAGWQAPGHTPWGSILEKSTTSASWIPEGSVFSPEIFSLALSNARTLVNSNGQRPVILPSSLSRDRQRTSTVSELSDTLEEVISTEIFDMMEELKSLQSFFQSLPGEDNACTVQPTAQTDTLSVPSLVVSNSHCTFPLPLESSQSLAMTKSSTLASRRGKRTPAPLITRKQKVAELAYPDIPTAFLGSPSRSPDFEVGRAGVQSKLRFEEMINNLRLQCSTMELHTPPVDTSWNSRSPSQPLSSSRVVSHRPSKVKNDGAELTSMEALLLDQTDHPSMSNVVLEVKNSAGKQRPYRRNPTTKPSQPTPSTESPVRKVISKASTGRQPTLSTESSSRKVISKPVIGRPPTSSIESSDRKVISRPLKLDTKPTLPDARNRFNICPGSKSMSPPSQPLRPAIAKNPSSQTKQHAKTVRFALTHYDLTGEEVSSMPPSRSSSFKHDLSVSEEPLHLHDAKEHCSPPAIAQETPLQRSSILTRKPSWRSLSQATKSSSIKMRSHSVTIGSPIRHSTVLPKSQFSTEPNDDCNDLPGSRRSTQSLGRHSLSRIMKHPMFSGRDNKRATISSTDQFHGVDENAIRRESQSQTAPASSILQKKSRMPVPLRNILTRFK